MKIHLTRSGGFAAVPGLNRPVSVDTAELPAATADEVHRFVAKADLANEPPDRPAPDGAADMRSYELTVDGVTHRFTDASMTQGVAALVQRLEDLDRR